MSRQFGGTLGLAVATELRKTVTTRTWWITAVLMGGYMAVMGAIMAFSFVFGMREGGGGVGGPFGGPAQLDPLSIATSVYTLSLALGYIFPAVLGAMAVTGEFRHRTITATFLAEPHRGRVLAAKLVAIVPIGLAVAIAGTAGTVLGGAATLALMGEPALLGDPEVQRTILLGIVALTIWAVVGVGFGSVLTNQVAAIVVLLAFTQFVEPMLRLLLAQWEATEVLSRYLPGAAGEAIAGSSLYVSSGLAELLPESLGALVLVAYGVVLAVIGRLTTFRRDIG